MAWCVVSWATDNSKDLVQKRRELAPEQLATWRAALQNMVEAALVMREHLQRNTKFPARKSA